jgi:hypothetical protein
VSSRLAGINETEFSKLVAQQIESMSLNYYVQETDILKVFDVIPAHVNFHLVTKYEGDVVHGLSFARKNGQLKRLPQRLKRLSRSPYGSASHYSKVLDRNKVVWRHAVVLLVPRACDFPEADRARIQSHINVLITQTQVWRNLLKDSTLYQVKIFKDTMAGWTKRSVEQLARFIADQFRCTVGIVNWVGSATMTDRSPRRSAFVLAYCTTVPPPTTLLREIRTDTVQRLLVESLRDAKVVDASFAMASSNDLVNSDQTDDIFFLPLCRATEFSSSRHQLLVVHRNVPAGTRQFTQAEILAIQEIISQYYDDYTQARRTSTLTQLAKVLNKATSAPSRHSKLHPQNGFARLARGLSQSIVDTTQARACAIYLCDPAAFQLVPIATVDATDNSAVAGQLLAPVSLKHASRSINAFVFRNEAAVDGFCYLPDLPNVPKFYRRLNLSTTTPSAPDTQSEACFSIAHGGVTVGTIYVESPLLKAFESDLEYLRVVARLVSSIYASFYKSFDARFIAERLSFFNLLHALRNSLPLIEKIDLSLTNFIKQELASAELDEARMDIVEDFSIGDLINSAKSKIASYGQTDIAAGLSGLVLAPGLPRLRGDRYLKRSLGHIIDNLTSNAVRCYVADKHKVLDGHKYKTEFLIHHENFPHIGTLSSLGAKQDLENLSMAKFTQKFRSSFKLVIQYIIHRNLSKETVENLGIRPIFDPMDGSTRFGLFIVGLIVRQLSGQMEAFRFAGGPATMIRIQIPIPAIAHLDGAEATG